MRGWRKVRESARRAARPSTARFAASAAIRTARHAAADGGSSPRTRHPLLHCQMSVARVAGGSWTLRNVRHMSEERLIKKYANRRLYDASQSRHITLDDIRNMVVAGVRVKVVEDKTNEDITRLILLQVIADQEQFGRPILSTPLLESLIRFYGNSLQSFLSAYLEKSVETFMRQQERAGAVADGGMRRTARPDRTRVGRCRKACSQPSRRIARSAGASSLPRCAPLAKTGGSPTSPALCRVTSARKSVTTFACSCRLYFEHRHRRRWQIGCRVEGAQNVELRLGAHRYRYSLLEARLPSSAVPLYLVHCPAVYDRPTIYTIGRRRAPALPGPAARRARRLPAPGVRAAHRSLQRLAHGARAAAAQDASTRGTRCFARRARCCRSTTSAIKAGSTPATTYDVGGNVLRSAVAGNAAPAAGSTGCAKACATPTRHHREPDVRDGDLHAARRAWPRRRAARTRRRRRRHPERRRLRRVESRDRPLPEASLLAAGPVRQGGDQARAARLAQSAVPTQPRRCSASCRA